MQRRVNICQWNRLHAWIHAGGLVSSLQVHSCKQKIQLFIHSELEGLELVWNTTTSRFNLVFSLLTFTVLSQLMLKWWQNICGARQYMWYVEQGSGVPRNFFWGGGFNKFSWGQRTQRTGIWGHSPLIRGSGGSCNLVQEISFHILKFS